MSAISSFKDTENKHVYSSKYCMKKFCQSLGEHGMKMIDFKKKKREISNKQTARIRSKCKNLLHL